MVKPVVFTCPSKVATAVPATGVVEPSAKFAPAEKEIGLVYVELAEAVAKLKFADWAPDFDQPVIELTFVDIAVPKFVE